ncbi:MAG: class I SAM-dependent methyltransferase [Bacteriovoracia bacterium]
MNENFSYQGTELALFGGATNWKKYFARALAPYIRGDVLEVGAGTGATTAPLQKSGAAFRSWTCLEPDTALLGKISAPAVLIAGNIGGLPAARRYDSILYIDVLEHIRDDRVEIEAASGHLNPGGRLIILAPAHQKLFSEFDRALGHHRRYNREALTKLVPPTLEVENGFYLDSAGLCASAANSFLLRSAHPRPAQIWFWDKILIPLSILLDKITARRLGKSVVMIAKKR